MNSLREGLPPLPPRMKSLPVDDRGYPVPYFVAMVDGKPDFRIADPRKWARCITYGLCWVCGSPLGRHQTYVAGPMCGINRTTSEPPLHYDCAVFSATACPFLTLPMAKRREANLPEPRNEPAGHSITRNPGVAMLWTTRYRPRVFKAHAGSEGYLFELPEPEKVEWLCQGRLATRAEILESIETGMPFLQKMADEEDREKGGTGATNELAKMRRAFERWLPAEVS